MERRDRRFGSIFNLRTRKLVASILALFLCLTIFPMEGSASVVDTTVDVYVSNGDPNPNNWGPPFDSASVGVSMEFDYGGITIDIDPSINRLTITYSAGEKFADNLRFDFSGGTLVALTGITKNIALSTAQNASKVTAAVDGKSIIIDNGGFNNEFPSEWVMNGALVFDFTSTDHLASSDAGLSAVLAQTITAGAQAGTVAAPKKASISVANAVSSVSAASIVTSDTNATAVFYGTDSTFTTPASSVNLTAGQSTNIYIKVTAEDAATILYYEVAVTRGADTQATPAFSPASGAIAWGSAVTITSAGADRIYYTTDGTDPATSAGGSTLEYTVPVTVSAAATIKAIAVKTGSLNSAIGSASYTQAASADLTGLVLSGSPAGFTFAGATYAYNGVTVDNAVASITVTPTGAGTITVDGVAVTSGQASGSIALTPGIEKTITVIAAEAGKSAKTYTIKVTRGADTQATPVFSPASGAIAWGSAVTITSAGADHIYYTTDGTDPATSAGGSTLEYTVPVTVSAAATIKAIAVKTSSLNSAIGSASYTQAASADLTGLVLSGSPAGFTFAGAAYAYNGVTVDNAVASITVTPTGTGTITADGVAVTSGEASGSIALTPGVEKTVTVVVTEAGKSAKTYTIKITRMAQLIVDAEDGGVTCEGIEAAVELPALLDSTTGRVEVALSVEPVSDGSSHANYGIAAASLAAGGKQVLAGYDISLTESIYNGLNQLQSQDTIPENRITGNITVRLPLPSGYETPANLQVVYIDDNGKVTPLTTTVITIGNAKYLAFTTDHFSLYAVVFTPASSIVPAYGFRTLKDPVTVLSVSGYMADNAVLQVQTLPQNMPGALGDAVRERLSAKGDALFMAADVAIAGEYNGYLKLSVPMDKFYNGQAVTLVYMVNGSPKTATAVVSNGMAVFENYETGRFALLTPPSSKVPQTGDSGEMFGTWALFGLASILFAAIVVLRKYYEEKNG